MTQRVQAMAAFQPRATLGRVEDLLRSAAIIGSVLAVLGNNHSPGRYSFQYSRSSSSKLRRQQGIAILLPFALLDANQLPLRNECGSAEVAELP